MSFKQALLNKRVLKLGCPNIDIIQYSRVKKSISGSYMNILYLNEINTDFD